MGWHYLIITVFIAIIIYCQIKVYKRTDKKRKQFERKKFVNFAREYIEWVEFDKEM